MTKADKLRAALRDNRNRMTRAEALGIIGSGGNLSNMTKTGEVTLETIDGTAWVVLDPDYTKGHKAAKTLPIKRRAKKKYGHKKARKPARTYKKLLENVSAPSDKALLSGLAMDNMIEAGITLAATVRELVEDLEDNPTLRAAVEQQERAARIARAVNPPTPF